MMEPKKSEGATLWLTGLPCSGKSTLGEKLGQKLEKLDKRVELLDGDFLRKGICRDLGFSKEDREENIHRVGFLCQLLSRNGVFAIATLIAPYRKARDAVRKNIPNFIEIYVDTPLEECIKRDVKGMYQKALKGELKKFTGISDPYEPPLNPEVHVNTKKLSVEEATEKILRYLERRKLV